MASAINGLCHFIARISAHAKTFTATAASGENAGVRPRVGNGGYTGPGDWHEGPRFKIAFNFVLLDEITHQLIGFKAELPPLRPDAPQPMRWASSRTTS